MGLASSDTDFSRINLSKAKLAKLATAYRPGGMDCRVAALLAMTKVGLAMTNLGCHPGLDPGSRVTRAVDCGSGPAMTVNCRDWVSVSAAVALAGRAGSLLSKAT